MRSKEQWGWWINAMTSLNMKMVAAIKMGMMDKNGTNNDDLDGMQ